MTRKVPFSSHTMIDDGGSIYQRKRPDGKHATGTGGRLARCLDFEAGSMSGTITDWPVTIWDDYLRGYRLRGTVTEARFSRMTFAPGAHGIDQGTHAYVVRSYDQVILVAVAETGAILWVNPARYSMTTGGHQSAARWTGHDLRHPGCGNDRHHDHIDEVPSASFNETGGHGQPSLAERYR